MPQDPYAPYLRQADELFSQGEIVKAGQIWQAILKREPGHTLARERLLLVKQRLETQAAREAAARPAPMPPPEPPVQPPQPPPQAPDRLVAEGCTLYDLGQVQDALGKWEQALALDPAQPLALEYANGARRELGLPPLEPAVPAMPPALAQAPPDPGPVPAPGETLEDLLREAVQLYDLGLLEDAIAKWERALALDPSRADLQTYLAQARTELVRRTPASPMPAAPSRPAGPDPGLLDLKLRQAEHLLALQRPEEAAFTFQQALDLDPGNPRARQGLERCRRIVAPAPPPAESSQGRIPMALVEAPDPGPRTTPPASVVKAAPPRSGLALPQRLAGPLASLPWLRDPQTLALGLAGLLVAGIGLGALHSYRKDQALKAAVKAARAAALAPILREARAVDLTESRDSIFQEAKAALKSDPLRAYLRASTLVQRDPGDAAAAELLQRAKAALPGGAVGATLDEYQQHLRAGDLDAAATVMDALLRADPDNPDLRRKAARLELDLCATHAAQGRWDAAALDLERGRALFPDDKSWQARLALLGQVRAMPKEQRAGWIGLLG